jgi:hypothetical protein
MDKYFPEGSARSAIVCDDGELKSFLRMEADDKNAGCEIFGDYSYVEDIMAVMCEPVVAHELSLPALEDLVPDKYHIYRVIPPYYLQLWYKYQLSNRGMTSSYTEDKFKVDFITAYIIEFPWEQMSSCSRRKTRSKNDVDHCMYDKNLFNAWCYQKDTIEAVAQFLNICRIPASEEEIAKLFISRFIWYSFVTQLDLLDSIEIGEWLDFYNGAPYRSRCVDRNYELNSRKSCGHWGGLMAAGIKISRILEYPRNADSVKSRVLQRARLLVVMFCMSQSPRTVKLIIEGLMTFSASISGTWMLSIIEPLVREVEPSWLK